MKDFYTDYVPAHSRRVDWRNYRPRVAIVRLPDGDWGRNPYNFFRDRLLGDKDAPSDELSRQWLYLWPILTHGVMGRSTSLYNYEVYPGYDSENDEQPELFVPIDSVAVFDHTVTGSVLDSVRCFVVCGHALEKPAFDAIRQRVAAGATCIISSYLYNQFATGAMPGDWCSWTNSATPASRPSSRRSWARRTWRATGSRTRSSNSDRRERPTK